MPIRSDRWVICLDRNRASRKSLAAQISGESRDEDVAWESLWRGSLEGARVN